MSKKARKGRPSPEPESVAVAPVAGSPTVFAGATGLAPEPAWLDSPDPKKRRWGRIILVAVWIYVAALWLLALDQWFDWGIFGPDIPPI